MPPKLTREFSEMSDYKAAHDAAGYVYIGRVDDLVKEVADVSLKKGNSEYYGCVFCPDLHCGLPSKEERTKADEREAYEYNKAFFAGAIDARRSFVFVSELTEETGEIRPAIMAGYTGDELSWLKDNGYTFSPFPRNSSQTLATPPTNRQGIAYIRDYFKERGTEPHNETDVVTLNLRSRTDHEEPLRKKARSRSEKRNTGKQIRKVVLESIRDEVNTHRLTSTRTSAPAGSSAAVILNATVLNPVATIPKPATTAMPIPSSAVSVQHPAANGDASVHLQHNQKPQPSSP